MGLTALRLLAAIAILVVMTACGSGESAAPPKTPRSFTEGYVFGLRYAAFESDCGEAQARYYGWQLAQQVRYFVGGCKAGFGAQTGP